MSNLQPNLISIVVPAYNEAERILPTLRSLDWFFDTHGMAAEIVVVDDGSTDNTVEVVDGYARTSPRVRLCTYEQNRGKGHAVRVGMLSAIGAVRVMYDADGSMAPEELFSLLDAIDAGADIAIGSRYADGSTSDQKQPAWRVAWSRVANWIVRRSLIDEIADTQCGFKAFTAGAAMAIFGETRIDGWAFDLEALALAKRLELSVSEVAVHWTDDERSRVSPLKDFISIAREWWTIRQNFRRGVYRLEPVAARSLC